MPLPPATLPAPTVFPNTVKAEPALSGSAFRFPCQKFAEKNSRLSTNRVFHVIMPILKNEGGIRHGPVAKHAYQCRSAGPCVSQQMRTTQTTSDCASSSCTGCNQGRQELSSDYLLFATFLVTSEDAKAYLYSFSTKRRVYKWNDIRVNLYI